MVKRIPLKLCCTVNVECGMGHCDECVKFNLTICHYIRITILYGDVCQTMSLNIFHELMVHTFLIFLIKLFILLFI